MKKCSARNQAGKPCRANAISGSSLCVFHDPEHRETCTDARRQGGINRRTHGLVDGFPDADLRSIDGLLDFMECVIRETWALGNSVQRNRTLATLVQVQKGLAGLDQTDARIKAIEEIVLGPSET